MDGQLNDILFSNEKVLWQGKPRKFPYIIRNCMAIFPVAFLFLAFDGFFIYNILSMGEVPKEMLIFMIFFFGFHLMPVWIFGTKFIKKVAEHRNVEYAITDRRIIARTGLVGADFHSADYGDISGVRADVSPLESICRCGSVFISTSSGSIVFHSIPNPYEVYKQINKVFIDMKYDMHYPNAYRPEHNPGYNTEYRPK